MPAWPRRSSSEITPLIFLGEAVRVTRASGPVRQQCAPALRQLDCIVPKVIGAAALILQDLANDAHGNPCLALGVLDTIGPDTPVADRLVNVTDDEKARCE